MTVDFKPGGKKSQSDRPGSRQARQKTRPKLVCGVAEHTTHTRARARPHANTHTCAHTHTHVPLSGTLGGGWLAGRYGVVAVSGRDGARGWRWRRTFARQCRRVVGSVCCGRGSGVRACRTSANEWVCRTTVTAPAKRKVSERDMPERLCRRRALFGRPPQWRTTTAVIGAQTEGANIKRVTAATDRIRSWGPPRSRVGHDDRQTGAQTPSPPSESLKSCVSVCFGSGPQPPSTGRYRFETNQIVFF